MKLIVGLGNPGREYENTRHNIGRLALHELTRKLGVKLKFQGKFKKAQSEYLGLPVTLAETGSYINISGPVIVQMMRQMGTESPSDLLVLVDDIHLPLGRIRFRPRGSSGGHNGLTSIIESLASQSFARIRIGIGKPEKEEKDWKDYVLEPFLISEKKQLGTVLERVIDCALAWLCDPPEKVMQRFN